MIDEEMCTSRCCPCCQAAEKEQGETDGHFLPINSAAPHPSCDLGTGPSWIRPSALALALAHPSLGTTLIFIFPPASFYY